VQQIEDKISRSRKDKAVLDDKKHDKNKQTISDDLYMEIHNTVGKIVQMLIPNSNKMSDRPTVDNLLDMERQIDRYITYYHLVLTAEMRSKDLLEDRYKDNAATKQSINRLDTKQLFKQIKDLYKKERQQKKVKEESERDRQLKEHKQKEKEARVVIKGIHKQMKTVNKKKVEKAVEKTEKYN
jgi:hypothetical protein